jgi:hypothetical protein
MRYVQVYGRDDQVHREMVMKAAFMGESVQVFLEVKTRHLKRYCGLIEIQNGTHNVDI